MRHKLAKALIATALAAVDMVVSGEDKSDDTHAPRRRTWFTAHRNIRQSRGCWLLAAGGRIYDDWASAPDRAEPEATCPAYPVAVNVKQEGYGIWRC